MKRVVLDTSVLVAGLRSRNGAANRLIVAAGRRVIVPLASTALFLEYEDVLKRPEHMAATGLDLQAVNRFLAALADTIEPVLVYYRWRPQLADPCDEMVLEAAINGFADALITHNLRDFRRAERVFGIPVLAPRDVLRELGE
ncbi:MAG TPA: putative toxin-antitoxin system toxin component, PIN family [Azospirillum sp.]